MDPTTVPDVPNLDWWNQLRKQEQQNAPNKPPAPAPGSPQAMSSALMGGPDPYENMHGTGPQGNVANALLNAGSGALLKAREGISGQTQPSAEDLASGKVQIPSWQSAIPQAVGLGMQGQGLEGAALGSFGVKTLFEKNVEDFIAKNNLPPISQEQNISNIQARVRQIEADRRLSKVEGERYPPNAELFSLRNRLRQLKP